ncbi:hypothetical protein [Nocardia carnea]|uniref:hypothetical protein n=1 Tax=Nocardia carnea TaxID=37328 RepID=UPI0024538AE9|nr:hypothetical protein [Nocardia carnea]
MGTYFRQDPDDLRGRGNRHRSVVGSFLERAEGDPDWETTFLDRAGYGASPYLELAQAKIKSRGQAWTNVSNGHQGAGDVSHTGATEFETADTDGAAGADRVSVDPQDR